MLWLLKKQQKNKIKCEMNVERDKRKEREKEKEIDRKRELKDDQTMREELE